MRASYMIAIAVAVIIAIVAVEARTFDEKDYQAEFTKFVKQYNKNYAHDEFFARYNTFKANYDLIRNHNMKNSSYSMGVNTFADLTAAEFKARYTGYNHRDNSFLRSRNGPRRSQGVVDVTALPKAMDWVSKGAVTAVKNQQQCGSCWSFSSTGSLEGLYFQKKGKLVAFSEQQLIDCSTAQGNQGCNGGLMDDAFQYYITAGTSSPLCTETEYPYSATGPNTCDTSPCTSQTSIVTGFTDVTVGSESALMAAVALRPVSIAIEADQSAFQFYSGGVMDGTCGTQLDHGVLAVGFGTDSATGKKFWKVKNSWGATWGEAGYIRLVQGINQCGLTNAASYPTA